MTANYLPTSPDHLTGGRWMRDTWGVVAWVQIEPAEPAPDEAAVCTTCPARAWESCMNAAGNRAGKQHKGRDKARTCRCGNQPRSPSARKCQECVNEAARISSSDYYWRNKEGAV